MRPGVTSPLCRPRHNGKEVTHEGLSPFTAHGGNANITWSLFRSIGARRCLRRYAKTWEQCFASWPGGRAVGWRKGICGPDHVHRLLSLPPKYAVAAIVGDRKGKSAIPIARTYRGKERNFTGEKFWARGYCVSTVGANEAHGPGVPPGPGARGHSARSTQVV